MLRAIAMFLTAVIVAVGVLSVQAADIKAVKSDVSIKQDDKTVKARVGDVVEIKFDNSSAGTSTSQSGLTDLKLTIEKNKVLMDKHDEHDTVGTTMDGKSVVGSGFKSVYLYPAMEGKAKVSVEFKKGGKAQKHDYEIEVKGKK